MHLDLVEKLRFVEEITKAGESSEGEREIGDLISPT